MIDLGIAAAIWNGMPWYETAAHDPGQKCGECGRLLKVYHRRLSRSMARSLIRLYILASRYPNRQAFHVKLFDKEQARGEFGVLSCWGLVSEYPNADQTKRSSGMWSVTAFGKEFIELRQDVPQYAILKWGSELLGYAGPAVTVKQCLEHGNRFRYDEIMQWTPEETA